MMSTQAYVLRSKIQGITDFETQGYVAMSMPNVLQRLALYTKYILNGPALLSSARYEEYHNPGQQASAVARAQSPDALDAVGEASKLQSMALPIFRAVLSMTGVDFCLWAIESPPAKRTRMPPPLEESLAALAAYTPPAAHLRPVRPPPPPPRSSAAGPPATIRHVPTVGPPTRPLSAGPPATIRVPAAGPPAALNPLPPGTPPPPRANAQLMLVPAAKPTS
ncbi:hypothetical protein CDV55_100427 [Aspergillus turcosus]|uniref:Uncharacterized protein n=1 Tax=Aspergillus turcosus TaxID=1245748 RepID=A0A229WJS7_9EURO|nr:hypothetical protein CDV55_100427 [Aspergillus turcosus]RLL92886.1 hypothetical protein CFD26_100449 [Aspergillus turcosus]